MRQNVLDHLLTLGRGIEAVILAHLAQLGDLGGFELLAEGLLDGRRQFFVHNLLDILGNDILILFLNFIISDLTSILGNTTMHQMGEHPIMNLA